MSDWAFPVPDRKSDPHDWPDLMVLAATVLGEAEGEPLIGKRAVAYVITNRAADERWPDRPRDVCLQKLQFSCWNVGSPRVPAMLAPNFHVAERVWQDCFQAAYEALRKTEPDPSAGANHYLAPGSLKTLPSWARESKITARIGAHTFYRL